MKKTIILLWIATFLVQIGLSMSADLPNTPGTLVNNNFSSTLESFTDNITWVLQTGSTLYVDGHDADTGGAIYFGATTPYYELNETPATAQAQMSFYAEFVAKCNVTDGSDRTLVIADGGTDVLSFEVSASQTESHPLIRDQDNNLHDFGTISGSTIVGDSFSYHALQRNCTVGACDLIYYYNGSEIAWDNATAVDGEFSILSTAWFLGSNSPQTEDATGCSVSHWRYVIDENLTPSEAMDNHNLLFGNPDVNLSENLSVYWRFEESTEEEYNFTTTIGDNDTYAFTFINNQPNDFANASYGFFDEGIFFDGNDGLHTVTVDDLGGAFSGDDSYGISIWIKPINDTGGQQTIIYRDTSALGRADQVIISIYENSSIRYYTSFSRPGVGGTVSEISSPATDIFNGEWHNIIATIDPEGGNDFTKSLYFDGVLVYNDTWTTTHADDGSHRTTLGRAPLNHNINHFHGWMDELIYWGGSEAYVNESEATNIYNSGRGTDPLYDSSTNLILIDYRNGITLANLSDHNISVSLGLNDDVNHTWEHLPLIPDWMGFRNLSGINMTGTINNDTNYSFTTFLNESTSHGDTKNVEFYNATDLEINFFDGITGADVDNVTLEIVGNISYTNNTLNHTINTVIAMANYDLTADSNISYYPVSSEKTDQSFINSSTISGTLPFFNLSMFFTNSSTEGATNVTATVRDQTATVIEDAVIHVQRFNIVTNSFETQQILTTNFEGEARFQAILFTETYKFLIFTEEILRFTSSETKLFSDTINFFVTTTSLPGTAFFTLKDFNHAFSYSDETLLASLTWTGLDTSIHSFVCMNVTHISNFGNNVQVNGSCSGATSGTINIQVVNTTEETPVEIKAYLYTPTGSDEKNILDGASDVLGGLFNPSGNLGLFLSAIMILIAVGVSWWNPSLIPVTSTGAFLVAGLIGLHTFPLALTGSFMILGFAITIWISDKA